jgi:hypothetical protein
MEEIRSHLITKIFENLWDVKFFGFLLKLFYTNISAIGEKTNNYTVFPEKKVINISYNER